MRSRSVLRACVVVVVVTIWRWFCHQRGGVAIGCRLAGRGGGRRREERGRRGE